MKVKPEALHVHLDESSLHAPESFRRLLGNLTPQLVSDLVQMYGGADHAMYAMRGLSFKHQQTIPGHIHNLFREAESDWQRQGSPGKRNPPKLPPLEYSYGDNVRTKDGQIKGKAIGLRRFNKDENAYMYRVSHHDEPAIITVHPHTKLQRDGVAVKRRNYNESERPMNKREAFDELIREGFSPDEAIEFLSEMNIDEIDPGTAVALGTAGLWAAKKVGKWAMGKMGSAAASTAAPVAASAAKTAVKKAGTAAATTAASTAGPGMLSKAADWVATHVTPQSAKGPLASKAAAFGTKQGLPALKTSTGKPLPMGAAKARLLGNTPASAAARSQVAGAAVKSAGKAAAPVVAGAAALGTAAAGVMAYNRGGVSGAGASSSSTPSPNSTPSPTIKSHDINPADWTKSSSTPIPSLPSSTGVTPKPEGSPSSAGPKPTATGPGGAPLTGADAKKAFGDGGWKKPGPEGTPGGQTDFGTGGGVKTPDTDLSKPSAAAGGSKLSPFGQAFADARKAGKSEFSFDKGKGMQKYNTRLSGEGAAAHQRATSGAAKTAGTVLPAEPAGGGPKPMKATTDSPGFRAPTSGFAEMKPRPQGGPGAPNLSDTDFARDPYAGVRGN
jgi:hypothetical protein